MSCKAELTGDSSVYGAEIVQIVRRDRTCSRFYTGWVTDSPSAWLWEGPLTARMWALGWRVGWYRLVAGPAGRRLSRSGQRCTLSFDPELYVTLCVATSIRRNGLRERRLGRGSGIDELH
jgi:hypothetical protein